ncbi:patatin-like phospholipase family protein [Micromonospora sp. NPDC049497]|uniref:patatin-like phospholipase family protein n=1 Tax=Micromonospora sp. NPDC049497 TaxID=3364273 RepID=UPI0037BD664A
MRALVLGGGGVTGIAWELGVLAGLREHGVDLTDADLIVGTSAGAYVGALVATGVDLATAVADAARIEVELSPRIDVTLLAQGFAVLTDRSLSPEQARARLGALACSAPVGEPGEHVARFDQNLPVRRWPTRPRLVVTAVDTSNGKLVAWDATAGVPLAEAVAASCAVPGVFPPVPVGGTGHFMDGGVRSVTNADLAAGADAVVVLAPTVGVFRASPRQELARLAAARTVLLAPDDAARAAIGSNVLDPGRRGPALAAGTAQAVTLAPEVARVWRG